MSVMQGDAAGLSSCRVESEPLRAAALHQIVSDRCADDDGDVDNNDPAADGLTTGILVGPIPIAAQFSNPAEAATNTTTVEGRLVVTTHQVLFWANETTESMYDLSIDATAIDLHALTTTGNNDDDDSEWDDAAQGTDNDDCEAAAALYIQMATESSSSNAHGDEGQVDDFNDMANDDSSLFELTLVSSTATPPSTTAIQTLFDGIAKLISLNPIDPNGEDEDEEFGNAGNGAGWFGEGPIMTRHACDDDDLVIVRPTAISGNGEATEEERIQMLERLDNLLIVPREFEQDEHVETVSHAIGQFDDASEDEDNLL